MIFSALSLLLSPPSGFDSDVVYMCAYVPPKKSPYYTACDKDDGIPLLEKVWLM